MTINQTIDGVPREKIQRAIYCILNGTDTIAEAVELAGELRALLDAPAYPNRLCHIDYTAHPYRCGCLKGDEEAQRRFDEHQGKSAQPQGEPVAWTEVDVLDFMSVALRHADYSGLAPSDILDGLRYMAEKGKPAHVRAEQPATGAVVMPDRLAQNTFYSDGWNACLDEVTRLNSQRPTHANPPPGTEPSGTHHDNDGLDEWRKL